MQSSSTLSTAIKSPTEITMVTDFRPRSISNQPTSPNSVLARWLSGKDRAKRATGTAPPLRYIALYTRTRGLVLSPPPDLSCPRFLRAAFFFFFEEVSRDNRERENYIVPTRRSFFPSGRDKGAELSAACVFIE